MTRRAWPLRIVLASTAFGGAAGALALRTQLPPAWLLAAAVVAVVLGVVALPDPALQSPAAAVLAAAVASAVHGVLSATTTPTPQPVPDVVRPGPSTG